MLVAISNPDLPRKEEHVYSKWTFYFDNSVVHIAHAVRLHDMKFRITITVKHGSQFNVFMKNYEPEHAVNSNDDYDLLYESLRKIRLKQLTAPYLPR